MKTTSAMFMPTLKASSSERETASPPEEEDDQALLGPGTARSGREERRKRVHDEREQRVVDVA